MTTSPPSCAECHEIWEPKTPGTVWATPGFTFTFTITRYNWLVSFTPRPFYPQEKTPYPSNRKKAEPRTGVDGLPLLEMDVQPASHPLPMLLPFVAACIRIQCRLVGRWGAPTLTNSLPHTYCQLLPAVWGQKRTEG